MEGATPTGEKVPVLLSKLLEEENKAQEEKKEAARTERIATSKILRDIKTAAEKKQLHNNRSHNQRIQNLGAKMSFADHEKEGPDLDALVEENAKKRQKRWDDLVKSNRALPESDCGLQSESERQDKAEQAEVTAVALFKQQQVPSFVVQTSGADPLATPATAPKSTVMSISTPSKKAATCSLLAAYDSSLEAVDEGKLLSNGKDDTNKPSTKTVLFVRGENAHCPCGAPPGTLTTFGSASDVCPPSRCTIPNTVQVVLVWYLVLKWCRRVELHVIIITPIKIHTTTTRIIIQYSLAPSRYLYLFSSKGKKSTP